jgi:hypothetical protein
LHSLVGVVCGTVVVVVMVVTVIDGTPVMVTMATQFVVDVEE